MGVMGKRWNAHDIKMLNQYYPLHGASGIMESQLFSSRTQEGVKRKANKIGLRYSGKKRWTKQENASDSWEKFRNQAMRSM